MRRVAVVTAGLLLLTACGPKNPVVLPTAGRSPAPEPAAAGRPLISEPEVTKVIADVTRQNNAAMTGLDATLLPAYEKEAALDLDRALIRTSTKANPPKPFTYRVESSHVPDDRNDWFVVYTTLSSGGRNYALVMARDGDRWKLAHFTGVEVALPDTRRAPSGAAEVVPAADPEQTLLAAPQAVAEAHARTLTDGTAADPMFAGAQTTQEVVPLDRLKRNAVFKVNGRTRPAGDATVRTTLTPHPVRALRTADGGALVATSTTTVLSARVPGGTAQIKPGLAGLGTPKAGQLEVTMLATWWIRIPAKGAGTRVSVLGGHAQLVRIS